MLKEKYADRIQAIFAKYPADRKRSAVMPLLYIAQEEYGWVNQQGIDEVADICGLDPTQVKSIAGFYTMYSEKTKGKYWLQVCTDLACALNGADKFFEDLNAYLETDDDGHSKDGLFTVEHVMCLGACDRAPMMQCNFHFHENLDLEKAKTLIEDWRNHK
ncbi:MAG: NAD(P)H-dependent oxidoreductase subunit E [Anaerolineae bacterium]